MTHYMMDCFYPDQTKFDGFRRESFIIKVGGDRSAVTEAKALSALYPTADYFIVRKITKTTDKIGGECIYDSRMDKDA